MPTSSPHTFHIPVMGLAFSIDSPLKVGRYGISSVISLSDDTLIEQMREYYCHLHQEPYAPLTPNHEDCRARRITAYLDLMDKVVKKEVETLRQEAFTPGSDLTRYFSLLPDHAPLKAMYRQMEQTAHPETKAHLQQKLREGVVAGSIDANIMTKLDKTNYRKDGEPLPLEYSDALSALRGFAQSTVSSSLIFSAGMNMRLYGYMDQFPNFFPDEAGNLQKKIVIKVSDFRSAHVQGRVLAKKGLWVSEFRLESGLNCGGHAFATDGLLLGPILEEFRKQRQTLQAELFATYQAALAAKGRVVPAEAPAMRITVQGGIGTAEEQAFLLRHYGMDATGWGTPFLLVPEATSVDDETLEKLVQARQEDLYLSDISPLGVPFNALRGTTSELLKRSRLERGSPGSPCAKKHLVSNTEFTAAPICTASRKYQRTKLAQLQELNLPAAEFEAEREKITTKECLCEGLANTALLKLRLGRKPLPRPVTICPGPNLAYFSGPFTLQEMVDHIYGRRNILNHQPRPHMFVKELQMYVQYWQQQRRGQVPPVPEKQEKYLQTFRDNLLAGIGYYNQLLPELTPADPAQKRGIAEELTALAAQLTGQAAGVRLTPQMAEA